MITTQHHLHVLPMCLQPLLPLLLMSRARTAQHSGRDINQTALAHMPWPPLRNSHCRRQSQSYHRCRHLHNIASCAVLCTAASHCNYRHEHYYSEPSCESFTMLVPWLIHFTLFSCLIRQGMDFTCNAENVQRTCATFGKQCVGLAKYPNASVAEYGCFAETCVGP